MLPYHHEINLGKRDFDEIEAALVTALAGVGFGIITKIDMQATLKRKLGMDFRRYKILGACNPHFAHSVLQAEPQAGLLLPCNAVVQQTGDGDVIASVTSPMALFSVVDRDDMEPMVAEVENRLKRAIDSLV